MFLMQISSKDRSVNDSGSGAPTGEKVIQRGSEDSLQARLSSLRAESAAESLRMQGRGGGVEKEERKEDDEKIPRTLTWKKNEGRKSREGLKRRPTAAARSM